MKVSSLRLRWVRTMRLVVLLLPTCNMVSALGGEKASLTVPQMIPNISYRQNVCDRYEAFHNGSIALKDTLEGLKLSVLVSNYEGAFFNYDEETGIDAMYPGLIPVLLDEVARRGKFTWRDSFGISTDPGVTNSTWTELLLWGVEVYDLSADWWAPTIERMKLGVAFLEEWCDSSIILVSKEEEELVQSSTEISFWNWTRPYDYRVWILTVFTMLISGLVYQILEWFADERNGRSAWEWWQENAYKSFLNFTQAYEYEPKTLSGRLFGLSMALWALVMTATYTANLASLLVDRKDPVIIPQTMDQVSYFQKRVCTWEGTNGDTFIEQNFPGAVRVPQTSQRAQYDGLNDGACDYLIDSVNSWNKHKQVQNYNPQCDLYWVGGDRKVIETSAGFASKADSGKLCSGLIRDVINLHLHDMIEEGFVEQAWEKEHRITQDIDCNTFIPDIFERRTEENRRSLLGYSKQSTSHRGLKGGRAGAAGGAVASVSSNGVDDRRLQLEQMVGTFMLHYGMMAIALFIAFTQRHAAKPAKKLIDRSSQFLFPTNKDTELPSGSDTCLEMTATEKEEAGGSVLKRLDAMQESQTQMEKIQQELLDEQRELKAQIQALLQANEPSRPAPGVIFDKDC